MRKAIQFGLLLSLFAVQLRAAELANLRNGFNIRHERHEVIGDKTRLFLGNGPEAGYVDVATAEIESFAPAPPDLNGTTATPVAQKDLSTIVSDASARSRIDADFIASVIRAESGNNPRAVSPKGARGLMQLMPQTASTLGVTDVFDPTENVDGGVRYLGELLVQYNGDAAKALAAYNAGPHRVRQYGGVPPYRETHAYVARVINDYNRKKAAQMRRQAHSATKIPASSVSREVATNGTGSGGK
jgi:soluble lytic murein transglycosylase-like protein